MSRLIGSPWMTPALWPQLGEEDVHVWRATLAQPAASLQFLAGTLDDQEHQRAAHYYFHRDHDRFIARRGLLRIILSRYLRVAPAALRFSYGLHGKPILAPEHESALLRFNVSHSGDLALYAIAHRRLIGIDIEQVRPDLEEIEIAQRFFAPSEIKAIQALPSTARTIGFLNCWTRKEAFIKARGDGLSRPLNTFTVSLEPDAPAVLLAVTDDAEEVHRWSLESLDVGPDYVGALATQGRPCAVYCWQCPPVTDLVS